VEYVETVTREGFATWITIMGGFVNFILKFTAMLLNRYQNFTIDKSMVKKLYTKEKDDLVGKGSET